MNKSDQSDQAEIQKQQKTVAKNGFKLNEKKKKLKQETIVMTPKARRFC